MPVLLRFWVEGEIHADPYRSATWLRAIALRWIDAVDPELAATVHDINQPKPYSIRLMRRDPATRQLGAFDIAVLVDGLAQPLIDGCLARGERVQFHDRYVNLRDIEIVEHAPYEALIPSVDELPNKMVFDLTLHSPTAHHANGELRRSVLAPDPACYFGGWLRRWELHCPIALPKTLPAVIDKHVTVTAFRGETRVVRFDQDRIFIGYIGDVQFGVLKPAQLSSEERAALVALARFARYAGTGVDTMRGMGETELVGIR